MNVGTLELLNGVNILVLTGLAYFFLEVYPSSYFKKKAENLATKEDIAQITLAVEEVKSEYSRMLQELKHGYDLKLEEARFQLRKREQAASVAKLLAMWVSKPKDPSTFTDSEIEELNRSAWELTLWLPDTLAADLNDTLAWARGAKSAKEILVAVKKVLEGGDTTLDPARIVHFSNQRS